MVRSMYSGVAGMRANQNRMDVIGNNIANANTYGFKSGRATFRDIYYQQFRGASAGTQTRGGINPSSIGYGAQMASIDLMMDSSSMTSTGFVLDCAITGEGFFQVMDPDGNIYYTKAGMLDIDPATGALVDSNGNFVLGTSATDGRLDSSQPGQNKIIIALDAVQASTASITKEIGGRTLTIESTAQNKEANISFTFTKSTEMPDGQKVRIIWDDTTSMFNVQLNAYETFSDMGEVNELINNALTEAYGGEHPGGTYNFSIDPDPFEGITGGLTGAQLVDTPTVDYEGGSITITDTTHGASELGFKIDSWGLTFGLDAGFDEEDVTISLGTWQEDTDRGDYYIEVTMDVGGTSYTGRIYKERWESATAGGTVLLSNPGGDPGDTITLKYPPMSKLMEESDTDPSGYDYLASVDPTFGGAVWASAVPQEPTKKCGWGKATFTLEGGTEYHLQDISNITGISIGADGVISGTTENGLTILGRIDLANFANAKGLAQVGNSYFTESANSGPVKLCIAGEGGTGAIKNSALEMSNVDLAQEFSDMIVTQRGFQASSRMITVSDTMLEELTNLKR